MEEPDAAGLSAAHTGRRRADREHLSRRHQHAAGAPRARGLEGDPSLQARRKANRRLDQREELLEEALQFAIAHCYILPRLPGTRCASDLPHLAFPTQDFTESLSRSTARPPRSEYQ